MDVHGDVLECLFHISKPRQLLVVSIKIRTVHNPSI